MMTGTDRSADEIQDSVDEQKNKTDHGSGDEHPDPATAETDSSLGHEPPQTEGYGTEGVDTEDAVIPPGPIPGDRT